MLRIPARRTALSDSELRAYLLGQATEEQAAHLEARLLDDDEVFTTLRGVEDDLFDELARGTLTPDERARFVARYGADRDRMIVAQALAQRATRVQAATPTRVLPFTRSDRRSWLPLAAAAVLLAAAATTLWMRQRPIVIVQAPGTDRVTTTTPAQPPLSPAILLVTLATSRSAASTPEVTLPPGTPALELRVRLHPEDTYDRYVMALRSAADRIVWTDESPRRTMDSGERLLVGTVPADTIDAGSYELSVRGSTGGGALEAIGFTDVSIRR
jgi:hypothetical protein